MSVQREQHRQQAGSSDPSQFEIDRPPRKSTVVIGMLAAGLLFAVLVGWLTYRALTAPAPRQAAVVEASQSWVGAELVVTGDTLPHPYRATVDSTGRYTVPFFIPPGQYQLQVRASGAEVYRQTFELHPGRPVQIVLPREIPTTHPAAAGS